MAKIKPDTYDLPDTGHVTVPGPRRTKRKPPETMAEVFDEETRIVRLLLKRVAALPNEKSRCRVLERIYELREFPLIDQKPAE